MALSCYETWGQAICGVELLLWLGLGVLEDFATMLEVYDAALYAPPKCFRVEKVEPKVPSDDWQQVVKNVLHEQWVEGYLQAGEDAAAKATYVQVLATIARSVDDVTVRFVYFFAVNSTTANLTQYVSSGLAVLEQGQDEN